MMKHTWTSIYFVSRAALFLVIGLALIGLTTMHAHANQYVTSNATASRSPHDIPAFIRVVHASPDIGTADVFLDGSKLLSNFEFGTVTNYATVPPGPHKVQVSLIGRGAGAATITQTLSVAAGNAYTVAALGTQAAGFSLETFVDNNLITPGKAKFRFYHLSPGTGTVTVSTGNSPLIQGLGYQQSSNYVNTNAGSYRLQVAVSQPSVTLPVSVNLAANTVTSEFAVGLLKGTPAIQFVSAQVTGIPGLPSTGSDPRPIAASQSPHLQPVQIPFWSILSLLALLALTGTTLLYWRYTHYR